MQVQKGQVVRFTYTNHKNETKERLVKVDSVENDDLYGEDFSIIDEDNYRHFKLNQANNLEVVLDKDEYTLPEETSLLFLWAKTGKVYTIEEVVKFYNDYFDEELGLTTRYSKYLRAIVWGPRKAPKNKVYGDGFLYINQNGKSFKASFATDVHPDEFKVWLDEDVEYTTFNTEQFLDRLKEFLNG